MSVMYGPFNSEKMYTFLKGFAHGANMNETLRALAYAREKHTGQMRKSGEPYIVHPLDHGVQRGEHGDPG